MRKWNLTRRAGGTVRVGVVLTLFVCALLPAVLIAVLSFSNESSLVFPPRDWGLAQYRTLLGSEYWLASVRTSLVVGGATSLFSLLVGVPAAYALTRTPMPCRGMLTALGLAPLILPGVAYAVAMYTFFIQIGLLGSIWGLILAHTVLAMPFVVIIVGAAINRIPPELELVAMTLGARQTYASVTVTLRLCAPAIGASGLLAFITSFDEAVFVNFVGGPGLVTLPKAIFDSVRTGIDPVITAIGALLMFVTAIITVLANHWRSDDEFDTN